MVVASASVFVVLQNCERFGAQIQVVYQNPIGDSETDVDGGCGGVLLNLEAQTYAI
jgi:hypothetical protein